MTVRVSGKHMDVGEAFRGQILDRIAEASDKYFQHGYTGHVTLEKLGSRFEAECMLHLDSGVDLQARGDAHDPVAAFEKAAEHLEKRLRRYKRRLRTHRARGADAQSLPAAELDPLPATDYVLAPQGDEAEDEPEGAPAVIAEIERELRRMTVGTAVMAMDLANAPVFVFLNADHGRMNVLYRRDDGHIGWIDPRTPH